MRRLCVSIGAAGALLSGAGLGPGKPAAPATMPESRPTKVWVYFKDKGLRSGAEVGAALAHLEATYDRHAVERRRARRTRPGLFDPSDIPVAPAYKETVAMAGAAIHAESSWLNAVSVYATAEQARRIAGLPFVARVEPVRGGRRHAPPGADERPHPVPAPSPAADEFYGLAHDQLDQINLIALHARGFTGAGVRIGILDTGFRRTHAAFNYPGHTLQVIAEHDFVMNDGNTAPQPGDDPDQHTHGTMILGCLGAYLPNSLVGGAHDASFILCKTEDITSETPVEEDNYVAGLQMIEANGGDLATASLVYIDWYTYAQLNGHTAVATIAVNMATENGLYCCNAAGNSGNDTDPSTGHLGGTPVDAYKVLAIGAVDSGGAITGFSSDGPTADGRLKPEVLARGLSTNTVNPNDDSTYASASGTSLSTPLAACAVACLAQSHPAWSVNDMRRALMFTATDFVATGHPDPLMVRGYGIINADLARTFCEANIDGSSTPPVVNVGDFTSFLTRFALDSAAPAWLQLDSTANCDGSSDTPILNVADFTCFLQKFAAGCP